VIAPSILEAAERFRRPSNIGRLDACHGQAIMAAAVTLEDGEAPAAPEADLGNEVHGWVHKGVLWWRDGDGKGGKIQWGEAIAMACDGAAAEGMDSWSVHCIQLTLEFYRDLIAKYSIEVDNVLVEHALDMEATGFQRKGTTDLALVIPFELVVIVDLKAGFVDQGDASDHDQMAVYSAAAAETFKAKKVIVWLWQPREKPTNRASAAVFDADALRTTVGWSRAVLERSRQPTAKLCAGFVQCSTCPALRRCPAAEAYIMDAQEALQVMGKPTTPEAWGEIVGAAKLAEKWAETWKEAGKARLLAGDGVVGFKLQDGSTRQHVENTAEAFGKLREAGMEAEALDAITITPTKLARPAYQLIESYITKKQNSPSLVADKRTRAA
jgi:hypothetical protein